MSDDLTRAAFRLFAAAQKTSLAIKRHQLEKLIPTMDKEMIEFVSAASKPEKKNALDTEK